MDVPDELDLTALRGQGRQPGEEEFPAEQEASPAVNIDESVVVQLVSMGFDIEGCKKVGGNDLFRVYGAI